VFDELLLEWRYAVDIRTAFSVIFLLDVGHKSTGSLAHLTDVVVVGSVSGADRPAVDRVTVAATRLQTLAPRDQAVHRRHTVRSEAARLPGTRVLHVWGINITTGRRGREKTAGERQEYADGDDDQGRRR